MLIISVVHQLETYFQENSNKSLILFFAGYKTLILEGDFEVCSKWNIQMCAMHGDSDYMKILANGLSSSVT